MSLVITFNYTEPALPSACFIYFNLPLYHTFSCCFVWFRGQCALNEHKFLGSQFSTVFFSTRVFVVRQFCVFAESTEDLSVVCFALNCISVTSSFYGQTQHNFVIYRNQWQISLKHTLTFECESMFSRYFSTWWHSRYLYILSFFGFFSGTSSVKTAIVSTESINLPPFYTI